MKQREKTLLRSSSIEELRKKLIDAEKTLVEALKERYTNTSKNLRKVKMIRKSIAVIKTYIREKELQAI